MTPKPCLTYSRCSTTMQANFGVSLENQSAALQRWAESNGYVIVEAYVDSAVSGTKVRPELERCLERACKEKLPILTYSISRIYRNVGKMVAFYDRLTKAGGSLLSLTENISTQDPAGKLTFQIFVSLAEHERNLLSQRTLAAMKHLRSTGKQVSRFTPYGFEAVNGYLKPVEAEQQAIEVMKSLRASGLSYRGIAAELGKRGFKPHHAEAWGAGTLVRILARETEQVAA
jgi:DNA invertase Pin-like site-specific DNA recombinase